MDTCKCHYYKDGDQTELVLVIRSRFCRASKGGFLQKISYFDGREWLIKGGQIAEPSWTYRE